MYCLDYNTPKSKVPPGHPSIPKSRVSKGSILGNTLVFDPPNTLSSKSIIFNIGARLIFHHACKNGHGSIFRLYGIDLKKMSGFFEATQQHAEGPPTHLLSH